MGGKKKVILPVRHQMSMSELEGKTPLLAGKLVLDSSEGVPKIARKLVEVLRPAALTLRGSQADAQRANERLLEQLRVSGKNSAIDYRITTGIGVGPKRVDLESMQEAGAKDSIGSIFQSGMRVDLLPKSREKYQKNPLTFHVTLKDTGVKKFLKSMQTGRAQTFTASEFENFQTSLGLFPSFKNAETRQTLLVKPLSGQTAPVRVTFGSGSAAVVYDLMTHRMVRSGTLEAHGVLEGKDVPFVVHLRARRKPKLGLSATIESQCKGKSIRVVKKFVQMKRALWESGEIEIYDLESGSARLAGKLSIPPASKTDLWFGRVVEDVAAIGDFFGVDIKWPSEINEADIDLLIQLKSMIDKKPWGTGARFTSIVTKVNGNPNLFEALKSGGLTWVAREEPLVILGTPIEGRKLACCFEQMKIVDFEATKDRFDRAAEGEKIEVRFEAVGDIWIKQWDTRENRPVDVPNQTNNNG
jgi:hypothetical protein